MLRFYNSNPLKEIKFIVIKQTKMNSFLYNVFKKHFDCDYTVINSPLYQTGSFEQLLARECKCIVRKGDSYSPDSISRQKEYEYLFEQYMFIPEEKSGYKLFTFIDARGDLDHIALLRELQVLLKEGKDFMMVCNDSEAVRELYHGYEIIFSPDSMLVVVNRW
mmetsp:Transcript_18097/g.22245  ORF Transcript_18097/g.22245 Transcript_18097/m.22245 type:complete len:163 (+) Transcript_18097:1473-1961(+)